MYETVNSKTKLFTKLTNQSSCDEAWAMGCLLKSEKWIENDYNTVKARIKEPESKKPPA